MVLCHYFRFVFGFAFFGDFLNFCLRRVRAVYKIHIFDFDSSFFNFFIFFLNFVRPIIVSNYTFLCRFRELHGWGCGVLGKECSRVKKQCRGLTFGRSRSRSTLTPRSWGRDASARCHRPVTQLGSFKRSPHRRCFRSGCVPVYFLSCYRRPSLLPPPHPLASAVTARGATVRRTTTAAAALGDNGRPGPASVRDPPRKVINAAAVSACARCFHRTRHLHKQVSIFLSLSPLLLLPGWLHAQQIKRRRLN